VVHLRPPAPAIGECKLEFAAELLSCGGDYDGAEKQARGLEERYGEYPMVRATAKEQLGRLAAIRGRLATARGHWRVAMDLWAQMGNAPFYFGVAGSLAEADIHVRRAPVRGLKQINIALARLLIGSIPLLNRPYPALAGLYARAGRPARGRSLMAEYDKSVSPALQRRNELEREGALGELALSRRTCGRRRRKISTAGSERQLVPYLRACGAGAGLRTCGRAGFRDRGL
jgi:hypothetical protein